MKTPRYKIALFDMDGTIANTDPMIVATINDLDDKYRGGKRHPVEEIYNFSGPPIRETLAREYPELNQKELLDEFHDLSRSYYDTHIFPYPYCREALTKLKEDGVKLGVVTNKMHDLALVVINILHLDGLFDIVVGSTDVMKTKPDKEGIMKAISALGGSKEDTIYVGDNTIDLQCANNAGVDCCLVYWGPRYLPEDLKPTMKINSFEELLEKFYE